MKKTPIETPLQDALDAKKAELEMKIEADKLSIMNAASEDLARSDLSKNFLKKGDKAPNWELKDIDGDAYSLDDELYEGPVIISFYRGGWCPYCNLQLRAFQNYLDKYEDLGANLIVIGPETNEKTSETINKNEIEYRVLSDPGNQVARAYGLVFTVPEDLRPVYKDLGIDLPEYNGDESFELPVPGTFLIDEKGIIRYAFVNTDYTKRAEPELILKELKKLVK